MSNEESVRELVTLGNVLKSKKNHNGFYALHAIDNKVEDSGLEKRARKILETAATAAAASDIYLPRVLPATFVQCRNQNGYRTVIL